MVGELHVVASGHRETTALNILAVIESTLDNIVEELISIDGYKTVRLDRNKHGGGIAIFISEDLKFETRHDVPLHI